MPYDNHQDRLLALTEAHAIARHLLGFTARADDLARETDLPGLEDTLPAATEGLLSDAIDLYTYNATSAAGHSPDLYAKAALPAALGRVERLAALGREITDTANRLHTALETAADHILGDPHPTPDEIRARIAAAAAALGTDARPTQGELDELWTATRPTPGENGPIDLATSNALRVEFERLIMDHPDAPEWTASRGGPALDWTVKRWRDWYLEHEADWRDYDTWLYAAVHVTNWNSLDELWDRVHDLRAHDPKSGEEPAPGSNFTGPEKIALRDAIAAHIRRRSTRPNVYDDAYSLWCKVRQYDSDPTPLAFRIRLATDVAQAATVFELIRDQWETEGRLLPLLTSAARKATELAGLADTTDAINARVQVKAWRNELFTVAIAYAEGRPLTGRRFNFTPDQVSGLLYYAITTHRHADEPESVHKLLTAGHTAAAADRITQGDYEKLAIIANPTTRTEGDDQS